MDEILDPTYLTDNCSETGFQNQISVKDILFLFAVVVVEDHAKFENQKILRKLFSHTCSIGC